MRHGVSQETFKAAVVVAENTPDPRSDRVDAAIAHLGAGAPDSRAVAQAMIACILAEAAK